MEKFIENKTILCVDDDENILEIYRKNLECNKDDDNIDILFSQRSNRNISKEYNYDQEKLLLLQKNKYNVLTATSGEKAVEIVKKEIAENRSIAVGFFDMKMPGGIDGLETIKKIKEIQPSILCAIVTAYTDKSISQINELFDQKDEWLYINKPFTEQELEQTAINLVSSWNRKRREEHHLAVIEKTKEGLLHILDAVQTLSKIPPMTLQILVKGILSQILSLAGANNGFIFVNDNNEKKIIKSGFGKYKDFSINEFKELFNFNPIIRKSIDDNKSTCSRKACSVPLVIVNKLLGVIYLENETNLIIDHELMEIFRVQLAHLIENSKLYDELSHKNILLNEQKNQIVSVLDELTLSKITNTELQDICNTDDLTKLYNRRFFRKRIKEEFDAASRSNQPLSCFMIDIDNFKNINDTLGHDIGDGLLQNLSKLLDENIRSYDIVKKISDAIDAEEHIVVRYGGDEFILLGRNTSKENAMIFAERLKNIVENFKFSIQGKNSAITVSIGVATYYNKNYKNYSELIKQADDALYKAKENGRNRVEFANE